MKTLKDFPKPINKMAKQILSNAPKCCKEKTDYIGDIGNTCIYQCLKCKNLFLILRYDMEDK